jgi:hypothetical protein
MQVNLLDFATQTRVPKPPALLARLFVPLFAPNRRGNAGVNVIDSLGALAAVMPEGVQNLWQEQLSHLLEALPARTCTHQEANVHASQDASDAAEQALAGDVQEVRRA